MRTGTGVESKHVGSPSPSLLPSFFLSNTVAKARPNKDFEYYIRIFHEFVHIYIYISILYIYTSSNLVDAAVKLVPKILTLPPSSSSLLSSHTLFFPLHFLNIKYYSSIIFWGQLYSLFFYLYLLFSFPLYLSFSPTSRKLSILFYLVNRIQR